MELGDWQSKLSFSDSPPFVDSVYYYWIVAAIDNNGGRASAYGGPDNGYCVSPPTSADEEETSLIPTEFSISQNYPNPFNPSTIIEFDLPRRSNVSILVYNILGQEVVRLFDAALSAGHHRIIWNGRTANGVEASTGIYFYRIQAGEYIESRKMLLLK